MVVIRYYNQKRDFVIVTRNQFDHRDTWRARLIITSRVVTIREISWTDGHEERVPSRPNGLWNLSSSNVDRGIVSAYGDGEIERSSCDSTSALVLP